MFLTALITHRRILILALFLLGASTVPAATPDVKSDMPSWRGLDGSGVMPGWSRGIVGPDQARLLWTSEERHFGVSWGYGVGPANKNRDIVMSYGFSGPIAAGDSVYFGYFVPSGDIVDETVRQKGKDQRPQSWAIDADDVLLCLDADTGTTRWKRTFPGQGLNWGYHRKSPCTQACVVDGRVYWMGSAGMVYCVRASDGQIIWESHTGEGYEELQKMRQKMRADRSVETGNRGRINDGDNTAPIDTTPCWVDGVLICSDSLCDDGHRALPEKGNGLIGLEAATGKLLWRIPFAIGTYVSPVPWRHQGSDACVAVGPQRILCVEPRTGRIVWQIDERMGLGVTPAVSEQYLLVQPSLSRGKVKTIGPDEKDLTCFRLGEAGAQELWHKEAGDFSGSYAAPVIQGDYGYAHCKTGLICVALQTGEILGRIEDFGSTYLPLIACNGALLGEEMQLVDMDPRNFRVLGRLHVSHETFTPFHFSGGRVYVRGRLPGYENKNSGGMQPPEPGCIFCVDLRR